MPVINYNATRFPGAYHPQLAGRHGLDFTWAELVWSAISVGRRELLHIFRHGPFSAFEMVYRAAMVYANLCQTASDTLTRSSAYDGLDPSEKSAISYFMGMTLSKLVADKLLNVPWLMHLDVYRDELDPTMIFGNSRPDLIGQTPGGDWIAIESKGRTNEFDVKAFTSAKAQAENLASVQGVAPTLRIALMAYFSDGILQCSIDDPEKRKTSIKDEPIDIPLTKERLLEGYYRPFREWLLEAPDTRIEEIGNHRYRIGYMPEVDVSVGVTEDLLVRDDLQAQARPHERLSTEHQYGGPDGLLVRVGPLWSEANMRREPQERRTVIV